mgnify:CR=1 FL=1
MRKALLKGKTLYTPYGEFRCPSGRVGCEVDGQVKLFSGSNPIGCLRGNGGDMVARIWDTYGGPHVETFHVIIPEIVVKLQEKTHSLPKGGEGTQYTVTVPRAFVESLGWKKGDRLRMKTDGKSLIQVVQDTNPGRQDAGNKSEE